MGIEVGAELGTALGPDVGTAVGNDVGWLLGTRVGADEGTKVGINDGQSDGTALGTAVVVPKEGCILGTRDGIEVVATAVGIAEGAEEVADTAVGDAVIAAVPASNVTFGVM